MEGFRARNRQYFNICRAQGSIYCPIYCQYLQGMLAIYNIHTCRDKKSYMYGPLYVGFRRAPGLGYVPSRPAIGAACPADRHTAPSHGRLRPLRNGYNRSRLGRGRARDTPIPGTTHLPSSEWNVPSRSADVLRTAVISSKESKTVTLGTACEQRTNEGMGRDHMQMRGGRESSACCPCGLRDEWVRGDS